MSGSFLCAGLIPCRNEAGALPGVLEGVRRFLPTVLVVDDGSEDGTGAIAREMGALRIGWRTGHGKGAALQAGFRHLLELGFTHALTLDGDGQHSPQDIPRFLACSQETGADLVAGSRMMTAATMPWSRRMTNRAMSALLSYSAGRRLPDSQCGFRLVDLGRAREAAAVTRHFEYESELLVKFVRGRLRVEFVPIQTIYRGERSKICPLVDTWRWLRWYGGFVSQRRHTVQIGGGILNAFGGTPKAAGQRPALPKASESFPLSETDRGRSRRCLPCLPESSACAEI